MRTTRTQNTHVLRRIATSLKVAMPILILQSGLDSGLQGRGAMAWYDNKLCQASARKYSCSSQIHGGIGAHRKLLDYTFSESKFNEFPDYLGPKNCS